ncbi:MAG TPA: hypothetical protein VFK10_05255, partial [Burkholderiaceae bacterium]|nr:hypothetical protein [Burkholderiaceae bacterium]
MASAAQARPRGSKFVLAAASAWCRIEAIAARQADNWQHPLLSRVLDSAQRVSGAAWGMALNAEEKSLLTVAIYDDRPALKAEGDALFEI